MPDFDYFPVGANAAILLACAVVIGAAGWHLATLADRLADRTGLGEAVTGAIFLGATTSLSGSVTSATAAAAGHADLAISNAIGGIAAQTMFLAIADIVYSRSNLEHAAASVANIMQAAFLVVMLTIVLLAMLLPEVSVLGVHPASLVLVVAYCFGMRLVRRAHTDPMWRPRRTQDTRTDVPDEKARREALAPLLLRFAALAALIAAAGWVVARSGIALITHTGLTETAVGGALTSVATSLPELVTALSAVRQGALTLAVGNIVGGNVFDTLFVAICDVAYRGGSVLHAVSQTQLVIIAVSLLQTGILLMGFVHRERRGIANIGLESVLILLLYLGLVVFLFAG